MAARPGLPKELGRALATTDMIESAHSVVRQTCPGARRWRGAGMGLRRTCSGMPEAGAGMRRPGACRQLPILGAAPERHHRGDAETTGIDYRARAA